MRTDKAGVSTCLPGKEQYEGYISPITGEWKIQYEYRTEAGILFSCVTDSVAKAREKKDKWVKELC